MILEAFEALGQAAIKNSPIPKKTLKKALKAIEKLNLMENESREKEISRLQETATPVANVLLELIKTQNTRSY